MPEANTMHRRVSRRRFISTTALAVGALPGAPAFLLAKEKRAPIGDAARLRVRPFELKDIRLRSSPVLEALAVNRRYLMELDPDRLLHTFRLTAGIASSAAPLGGWEAPNNELRGHFTGHYLSACALLAAQTGDPAAKERGDFMVAELAKCQAALGNGYLSAFPEELFDRLRAGKPAWAPFYTIHKIMAGLLDSYSLSGNAQALRMLRDLAQWTERWVQPMNEDHMARVLEREYGGMNELLYNFAAITDEPRWLDLARRFDRQRIYEPLAAGRDELKGLHVNTTIPQIIGAARGYELTGDQRLRGVAEYFWHTVTERRTYCTGGTSNGESWNAGPNELAKELSGYTQECCVTYNLQKLTRQVFCWTADPRAADYYERAFYNGILGVQHPDDGNKLYYVPLQTGLWKMFGTQLSDFWCCTGSMAESFAKLGDSIYFHDPSGIYVNLFVASEVTWRDKDLRLVQETRFPDDERSRLSVRVAAPTRMALRIRVPYWAANGSAALNGKRLEGFAAPGSYFVLDRVWRNGDHVDVNLPMNLHLAAMPDDPTMQAVLYGPLVLAGKLGKEGLNAANLRAPPTPPRTVPEYPLPAITPPEIRVSGTNVDSWLRPVPGRPLEFRTAGQLSDLTFVPLNRLFDERYGVYWKVRQV
jgi:DUF1680 family protein